MGKKYVNTQFTGNKIYKWPRNIQRCSIPIIIKRKAKNKIPFLPIR